MVEVTASPFVCGHNNVGVRKAIDLVGLVVSMSKCSYSWVSNMKNFKFCAGQSFGGWSGTWFGV
jgi:hypothetical protein